MSEETAGSARTLTRRSFLTRSSAISLLGQSALTAGLFAAANSARGATLLQDADESEGDGIQWHDVRDWGLEGRGYSDTESYFDRLPARAKGIVRSAVWGLSRHSAGMMVRFRTNATAIHTDHAVTSSNLSMPHMPATGVSGLDLYAQDTDASWKWVAVTRPASQEMNGQIVSGLDEGTRNFSVYLPLYNGTSRLRIGVPKGSTFEPIAPRTGKPIVFYGTSITHGACASRPGMPHPAILGRRLDCPVINLGFSGNGKMEATVGQFLTELDPAAYVIDCLPNMSAAEVTSNTIPLVKQLRAAHPKVPLVLVEDRSYPAGWIKRSMLDRNLSSRESLKKQYQLLLEAGVEGLYYVDGESLLSQDRDDTTDGSHPSDLGFYRHADAMEPILRQAMNV
ncbi:MAG: SGNH/GDSL hydrolase family protein [Planctomycetaceae bacterium]|nr:SGNH/GDSL hydrolase family protein [Planctomycetaceae bacterium]